MYAFTLRHRWWTKTSYSPNLACQDWYQPHPFGDLRAWERRFSTPTKGAHHTDSTLHQLCSPTGYVSNPCSRTPRLHPSDKIVQARSAIQQRTFGKAEADGGLCWSYAWYCSEINYDPSTGIWLHYHTAIQIRTATTHLPSDGEFSSRVQLRILLGYDFQVWPQMKFLFEL